MSHPAAEHMISAFQEIYRENSTPYATRLPSGGVVLGTGEPDPFGNFAAGFTAEELPDVLARLTANPVPAMIVKAGEPDAALTAEILPHGFQHVGAIPAMAVRLEDLVTPELPEGYAFRRLDASDDAAAWARVLSTAYPVATKAGESMSPVHVPARDAADAAIQFFAVEHNGEIAGVSMLVLAAGVAGVYCVATAEAHRKRGLGSVLTAYPLLEARKLGYETGVLQASEAGYSVYVRLGFRDAGAVQLYLRSPEGSAGVH